VTDGWGNIKDWLKTLATGELIDLIRDLYRVSPENRQFLQGRLLPNDRNLEQYRDRVLDAVFPDPLSRKRVRIAEAERLIRHFRLSTLDDVGTTDLRLAFVEAGTEQAADLGYGDEKYFAALLRALESVVDALPSLPPEARLSVEERLRDLRKPASRVGWGYPDAVRDVIAKKARAAQQGDEADER
jgi:hypothetical protein